MRRWKDEKLGNCCEPDCVDEWLCDLIDIGFDYDGCGTVESLQGVIDELVEIARQARKCLWENKLFGEYGCPEGEKTQNDD